MLEIEIKAQVIDQSALRAALCRHGFVWQHTLLETDVYYNGVDRNFAQTDEALRLRTTKNINTGANTSAITYKGPKLDSVSKTRTEFDVGLADGSFMHELLIALGHRPVLTVRKRREYYTRQDTTACLDEVEGLGSYIELETLSGTSNAYDAVVDGLFTTLKQLGIPRHACVRKSYLELLLEKISAG